MMQQSICAQVRVRVLNFAQQEWKRRSEHTWCGGFPSPATGPKKTWAAGRRAAVALAVAHAKRTREKRQTSLNAGEFFGRRLQRL